MTHVTHVLGAHVTHFTYVTSGGQVADTGLIVTDGVLFEVTSVQSFGGYVLHMGTLKSGAISTGCELTCEVDYERRSLITKSHTLTHVMNLALHR